jgi:hypothetical protein
VIIGRALEFVTLAKPDEESPKPVRLGVGDAMVLFRLPVSAFCALRCCSEVAAAVEDSKFDAVPFFPNPVAKVLTAGSVSEVVPELEGVLLLESDVLFDAPVVVPRESEGVVDDPVFGKAVVLLVPRESEGVVDDPVFGKAVVLLVPLFDPSETPCVDEVLVAFKLAFCTPCACVVEFAAEVGLVFSSLVLEVDVDVVDTLEGVVTGEVELGDNEESP